MINAGLLNGLKSRHDDDFDTTWREFREISRIRDLRGLYACLLKHTGYVVDVYNLYDNAYTITICFPGDYKTIKINLLPAE